jgi:hypothetical protein
VELYSPDGAGAFRPYAPETAGTSIHGRYVTRIYCFLSISHPVSPRFT